MTRDMTDGKPILLMARFCWPMLLANVLQLLYTLADSAVVGRILGVNAFAAVGATAIPHWLVMSAVLRTSHGFSVLFAKCFGAKDTAALHRAFFTSIYLTAALGIIIGLAGIFGSRPLLGALNTPAELMNDAALYMQCLIGGMCITFIYNTSASMLRALGDSRTPLYAVIISSVLNIVLDLILVFPFGIAGVAAATLIAQVVASAYCLISLRKNGAVKGGGRAWDSDSARELLRLGIPLGLSAAAIEIGGLIVQRYINGHGTEFVAGIAAAKRMYSLLMIAAGAVEAAVATFTAQNFGAGRFDRIKQGVRSGLMLMMASFAGLAAFTLLFGRWILGLMIQSEPGRIDAVLDVGTRQLNVMVLGLPLVYILLLYRAALQGMNKPRIPALSGFFESVFRVVSVLFLTPVIGVWGIYVSDPLGWLPAAMLAAIAYGIQAQSIRKQGL